MPRRRNRAPHADVAFRQSAPQPAPQPDAAPQLPALSAPVVLDRSKAKVKHMRTLANLGLIRTEAEALAQLPDLIVLLNDLVVGGVDDRPAGEFWAVVAEVRRQLGGDSGN